MNPEKQRDVLMDEDAPQHAIDCEIDDPELTGTKKHLSSRGGALNMIEALKGKHKNLGFIELLDKERDLKTNKDVFTSTWSLRGYSGITGTCRDYNK